MSTFFEKGFMDNYTLWTKHSEPRVPMEDNEGDNDVYLRPLVDELLLLWKREGVHVRDEYK